MKVNDIRSLAISILLCCVSFGSAAQQYENSIFNKPLKLDATVKTERVSRSTQKGDTLVFNASAYQVSENADSERLVSKMPGVTVTDNGTGISPEILTNVFKSYTIQESTTPEKFTAGLGLSVADGVAKIHGGTLIIDSKVGIGTKVVAHIPKVIGYGKGIISCPLTFSIEKSVEKQNDSK